MTGALVVAGLALAASAGSVVNGFALDDIPIIARNEAVHSLANFPRLLTQAYWPPEFGPSLYRPFTSLAFSFQWALGGGSPLVFHLVSITLYVATSLLVLRLAGQIMKPTAALAAAAIFAVHPLHVEAVANVVGQAELWTAMLMLIALSRWLECLRAKAVSSRDVAIISALFAAALMFKEHAIILPGVLLAAVVIHPSDWTSRDRTRRVLPLFVAMSIVAVSFVVVRTLVLGRFAGGSTATALVDQGYSARLFTMLNVIPEWLRLFVWPANLSADYSPPRIGTATSFEFAMLPGVLVIVAAALIAVRSRRGNPAVTFSLSLAGLALLIPSNLVIVTGFVLAERSLFLPSVGVAMVMGLGLAALVDVDTSPGFRRLLVQGVFASLLLMGVLRSLERGAAWRNNEALFRQTVLDVPTSYRAHLMLGELLWENGERTEALTELALAVRFSRKRDYYVRWLAADRYHAAGQLETASRFYREALALKPTDQKVRYGAAMALLARGHGDEARALSVEGVQRDPADPRFRRIVHVLDSVAALQPGG